MLNEIKIRCFISVAKHGSFTKAANELFLARQSVSRQIQMLENDLDTHLFIRRANLVELSETGRLYYDLFSRQIAEYSDLRTELSQKGKNSVCLRIGLLSGISVSGHISKIIDMFHRDPRVKSIEFEHWNPEVLADRFESKYLDMIFCFLEQVFHTPKDIETHSQHFVPINSSRIVLAVSANHPKATSAKSALDFQGETFVSCSGSFNDPVIETQAQTLQRYGLNPSGFKECVNLESAITELKFGNSLMIASNALKLIHQPDIKLFPLENSVTQICLWHADEQKTVLLDLIEQMKPFCS